MTTTQYSKDIVHINNFEIHCDTNQGAVTIQGAAFNQVNMVYMSTLVKGVGHSSFEET